MTALAACAFQVSSEEELMAKVCQVLDKRSKAATPQPAPSPGQQDVATFVLQDIEARIELGVRRYGTRLQTHNGRDALWDAYQEALDLVMYLRQAILERETDQ